MSLLLRLANQLILEPSTDPIDSGSRERVSIQCGDDKIEAWVVRSSDAAQETAELFCLKFPGTGGRAERAGPHPAEYLSPGSFQTWAINPPGYGTSSGQACVSKMPMTCQAAWRAISEVADDRPVLVSGNSLGCLYAMYVASRFPVAGLMLRNPAPVHQLIRKRYSWWNFGLANLIGRQVPAGMDAVDNAVNCHAPALFITSDSDRLIPPGIQRLVFDAYAGPHQTFVIPNGDHHTPISEASHDDYCQHLELWKNQLDLAGP